MVYATGRSNAVVPVWFLFYLPLWFLPRGLSGWVLHCSLFSCLFQSCLALWSSCLGKRDLVYSLRAFLFLSCIRYFLSFSLPLGVGGLLWIVIVTLPWLLFYLPLWFYLHMQNDSDISVGTVPNFAWCSMLQYGAKNLVRPEKQPCKITLPAVELLRCSNDVVPLISWVKRGVPKFGIISAQYA